MASIGVGIALVGGCTSDSGSPSVSNSVRSAATTAAAPTTQPVATGASASDRSAVLDQSVRELAAMPGGPPGVIVVVQLGDRRTVHVAGVADVKTGAAPGVNDHMRIASVAKALSGATALALVDQGTLSLDDTIGKWLPQQPKPWARVTLRQLLNHTSGLPDFVRNKEFGDAFLSSPGKAPEPASLIAFAANEPLTFAPGSEYQYTNSDNVVVGLMIEAATGRPYAQVLEDLVLTPLSLDDTSLPSGVDLPAPYIHGYQTSEPAPAPLDDVTEAIAGGWAWASGGVVSTPSDLNDFIRGYVSGALYSDKVRAKQQALFIPAGGSEPPGPGLNSATMALFRYETPCGAIYGHTGNTFGYTQFAAASPDGQRSATVSINLQRTADDDGQRASVFKGLQRVEQAAICVAMEGN
jgi:D-alanyl-D-alanine carboxypeptidase